MIRFTYGEIARSKRKWINVESYIHDDFPSSGEALSLLTAMNEAYLIGRNERHSALEYRFYKLIETQHNRNGNRHLRFRNRGSVNEPLEIDPHDVLVTDKTDSLSEDELSLLSKGPKFALSPPVDQNTLIDLNVQFCRFAHQFRWKIALENRMQTNSENVVLMKYPWDTHLKMPERDTEIEDKLKRLYFQTKDIILNEPMRPKFCNLTVKVNETR